METVRGADESLLFTSTRIIVKTKLHGTASCLKSSDGRYLANSFVLAFLDGRSGIRAPAIITYKIITIGDGLNGKAVLLLPCGLELANSLSLARIDSC